MLELSKACLYKFNLAISKKKTIFLANNLSFNHSQLTVLASIDAANDRAVDTWWADQLEVVGGRARTNIGSGTAWICDHKIVKVQSGKVQKNIHLWCNPLFCF
jgi:hypothetical protein